MDAGGAALVVFLRRVLEMAFGVAWVAIAMALLAIPLDAQQPSGAPLPEIRQLIEQVREHQRQLDKVRENYTYTSTQTLQDIDANGQVKKSETNEFEVFFVNSHSVSRMVKKDGKPLDEHDQAKETERVTREAEKAGNTPPDQQVQGQQQVSITQTLELMDVRNPRRETYRGRPSIVFDFVGRKDAKTHGVIEDASKKLEGTLWIDEADREVAHMDVKFIDNFRVAGGLVATIRPSPAAPALQRSPPRQLAAKARRLPATDQSGSSTPSREAALYRARYRLQALPCGRANGEGREGCGGRKAVSDRLPFWFPTRFVRRGGQNGWGTVHSCVLN